jgi:hypothetical protein
VTVHHQDPLHLGCGHALLWHVQLDRSSGLLAGELALSWRYLLLSGGLWSMGLCLLPPMTSATSLKMEAGFRLRHLRPWGNHRRDLSSQRRNRRCGLSSRSILHPWCSCDRSEQSPHVVPPRSGEAEAPVPAGRHEDLLDGVPYHPCHGDEAPMRVEPMKVVLESPLLEERHRPLK